MCDMSVSGFRRMFQGIAARCRFSTATRCASGTPATFSGSANNVSEVAERTGFGMSITSAAHLRRPPAPSSVMRPP